MVKKNLLTLDLQKFAEEVVEESGENEVETPAESQEEPEAESEETVEEDGNDEPHEQTAEENGEEAEAAGSYLAFGPYIALSLICYLVFTNYFHLNFITSYQLFLKF